MSASLLARYGDAADLDVPTALLSGKCPAEPVLPAVSAADLLDQAWEHLHYAVQIFNRQHLPTLNREIDLAFALLTALRKAVRS